MLQMPSDLNLCDCLINKLSKYNGVVHTLSHFPQIEKHEASQTLSLSGTQTQLPNHTSCLCQMAQSQSRSYLDRHWSCCHEVNHCVFPGTVPCPHVPGTSWSTFPTSLGGRSGAGLQLCSHGVWVRVLSWRSIGDSAVGKQDALACPLSALASHLLPDQLDLEENG